MSTKKIEGYAMVHKEVDGMYDADFSEVDIYKRNRSSVATLVIHSGLPEPVFTQSEVVAMLREVQKLVSEGGQIVIAHDNPQAEQRWQKALRKVRSTLKNHGIEVL